MTMKIEGLLSERYVRLNMQGSSKQEVIDAMLALVAGHDRIVDHARLVRDVWKRENDMSTGIGKGIGLPHAKTAAVTEPVLAMATLASGVDFDAIDEAPVSIVFLLATPEAMLSEHLKLLGRISRLVGSDELRKRITAAAASHDVIALLREEEMALPQI